MTKLPTKPSLRELSNARVDFATADENLKITVANFRRGDVGYTPEKVAVAALKFDAARTRLETIRAARHAAHVEIVAEEAASLGV